jgi:hypothetical protein
VFIPFADDEVNEAEGVIYNIPFFDFFKVSVRDFKAGDFTHRIGLLLFLKFPFSLNVKKF